MEAVLQVPDSPVWIIFFNNLRTPVSYIFTYFESERLMEVGRRPFSAPFE